VIRDVSITISRLDLRSVDLSTPAREHVVTAHPTGNARTFTHATNQRLFVRSPRLGTGLEMGPEREENTMSQLHVERIIGVLATDEALRRKFTTNPTATLKELAERGIELTSFELASLACLDPQKLERFARAIDARLQKIDLKRGEK